jgi:hypothetical protein
MTQFYHTHIARARLPVKVNRKNNTVACRVVRATKMTGSISDDLIY